MHSLGGGLAALCNGERGVSEGDCRTRTQVYFRAFGHARHSPILVEGLESLRQAGEVDSREGERLYYDKEKKESSIMVIQ